MTSPGGVPLHTLGGHMAIEDDLRMLEQKIKALKLEYEQYFLGTRPREPRMTRQDVQKQINIYSNTPIQNTAMRFKFNSVNSRYQAFKRQWDQTLREIEAGTYARHVFKADMHDRARSAGRQLPSSSAAPPPMEGGELFEAYRDAALACGQSVSGLTPAKLQKVVAKQKAQLCQKLGCDDVTFRVSVEDGKVKLKASPA